MPLTKLQLKKFRKGLSLLRDDICALNARGVVWTFYNGIPSSQLPIVTGPPSADASASARFLGAGYWPVTALSRVSDSDTMTLPSRQLGYPWANPAAPASARQPYYTLELCNSMLINACKTRMNSICNSSYGLHQDSDTPLSADYIQRTRLVRAALILVCGLKDTAEGREELAMIRPNGSLRSEPNTTLVTRTPRIADLACGSQADASTGQQAPVTDEMHTLKAKIIEQDKLLVKERKGRKDDIAYLVKSVASTAVGSGYLVDLLRIAFGSLNALELAGGERWILEHVIFPRTESQLGRYRAAIDALPRSRKHQSIIAALLAKAVRAADSGTESYRRFSCDCWPYQTAADAGQEPRMVDLVVGSSGSVVLSLPTTVADQLRTCPNCGNYAISELPQRQVLN